jgi:predicted RNA-binding Zn-ribbon protein involved in translation (DUF1610 family)
MRKEEIMRRLATRQRKTACPSCGASILIHLDNHRIGTCPRCGEWLALRNPFMKRLEVVRDECKSDAFEESEEWIRRVTQVIG